MQFSVTLTLSFVILFVGSHCQFSREPFVNGVQTPPPQPPVPATFDSCGGATFYQDLAIKKKTECDKKEEAQLAQLITNKNLCLNATEKKLKTFEDGRANCTAKRNLALQNCANTLQSLQGQRDTCVKNCPKTPAGRPVTIPNLLNLVTGSYYISSPDQVVNWYLADLFCKSNGMELASIETTREDEAIRAVLGAGSRTIQFWISGSDLGSEGKFYWAGTGKPLQSFTNFAPGQPDNFQGNENCLMYWKNQDSQPYQWNDAPCEHGKARFICEVQNVR